MGSQMTRTQNYNFTEWMERMKTEKGLSMDDSLRIFNGMPVQEQQFVIRRRWFRVNADGYSAPIKRPLLGGRIEFRTS